MPVLRTSGKTSTNMGVSMVRLFGYALQCMIRSEFLAGSLTALYEEEGVPTEITSRISTAERELTYNL
jgi:hypothetical protein